MRNYEWIAEIKLRLKAPIIALEKVSKGQYLPRIFAQAALDELRKIQKIVGQLENRKKPIV